MSEMTSASAPASKPSLARRIVEVVSTFVAMSGWRLSQLNVAWVVLGIASLALGQFLITLNEPKYTVAYWVFTLLFYYGGNTVLLVSRFPKWAIDRFGEERGYRVYQTILALMFIHQGLGVGAMSSLTVGDSLVLPLSPLVCYLIGVPLFAIGLVVKVWATVLVGVDIYYYKDMFLGRPVCPYVTSGPYKYFSNPMYGVGQVHGYATAILYRSWSGLFAIAVCHMLIYVFYYTAEARFVKRVYLSNNAAPAAQPAAG